MNINKNRDIAIFYTSGVCNLNCRYCSIDKNPVLKEIDEALAKSFEGDYYFNQMKKLFPDRTQLRRIETWGGEPFLYMERIHPVLHQIINYYPYFDQMFSSTNFSYDAWNDKIFNLFDQFAQYPYRDFTFYLQLSCDGPEEINDAGRGKGVTQKCLKNYNLFLKNIEEGRLPSNLTLNIAVKPTMDINNLRKIDSKEKIISYYKFFENNFIAPLLKIAEKVPGLSINFPVPNFAVPAPASKEDGEFFAQYCKWCREIEKENLTEYRHFDYYRDITMFSCPSIDEVYSYECGGPLCGIGSKHIGLLPNNMYSTCHEGFTQYIERYKEYEQKSNRKDYGSIRFDEFVDEQKLVFCLDEKSCDRFENHMLLQGCINSTAFLSTLVNQIVLMAMAGQIDKRYIDIKEAMRAGVFYCTEVAICAKENYYITGSMYLTDYGLLKLFLNGALDYISGDFYYGE